MSSKSETKPQEANDENPLCFVMMPISDPEGYENGHFYKVYNYILKPACERAGFRAIRADEVSEANLIHLDILQKIVNSPMALCDLSSRNPNALFELGLRQAFDKPVVLTQEIGTPSIFDIAPLRYINYRPIFEYQEVLRDQHEIARALRETYEASRSGKSSINSIVRLLSLTHPASLPEVKGDDKNSELLTLLLSAVGDLKSSLKAEIDSLKSVLKEVRGASTEFDSGLGDISCDEKDVLNSLSRKINKEIQAVDSAMERFRTGGLTDSEITDWLTEIMASIKILIDSKDELAQAKGKRFLKMLSMIASKYSIDLESLKHSHD